MRRLILGLYRCAVIAVELAQSVVTTFGGGNGDPGDIRKSAGRSR